MTSQPIKTFGITAICAGLGTLLIYLLNIYFDASAEGDAGCFSALGHQIQEGAVLYKDIFDNKAPGIFFLHALAGIFTQTIESNTGISCHQYTHTLIQFACMASFLIPLGWITYQKYLQTPSFPIINTAILGLSIGCIATYWPAMFVGGFTEEIGSYCYFAGLTWLIAHTYHPTQNNAPIIASGLFIGLSTWIKEPFILLLPAILPWGFRLSTKQKLQGLIGVAAPWIFYALYCSFTQSWSDYFHYLQFASDYATTHSESLINQNPITTLFALLCADPETTFQPFTYLASIGVIALLIALIFWGYKVFYFRLKTPSQSYLPRPATAPFLERTLSSAVLLLLGGFYFSKLGGKNAFPHYQLPWAFALAFSAWMLGNLIKKSKFIWGITILSLVPLYYANKNRQLIQSQQYPPLLRQSYEITQWENQLPNFQELRESNRSIYIDDPQAGRFYQLLNSTYQPPFPCPYYVYFYTDKLPKDTALSNRLQLSFYLNQQQLNQHLLSHPPDYIITGKNAGFLAHNSQANSWFLSNYSAIGFVQYPSHKFIIYQPIHRRALPQ